MKTLHTRSTKLARAAAITSISALGACVTAPHNDQWVDPADVDFAGYAEYAGADIEVQALDKQTGEWVAIDTSSAADSSNRSCAVRAVPPKVRNRPSTCRKTM